MEGNKLTKSQKKYFTNIIKIINKYTKNIDFNDRENLINLINKSEFSDIISFNHNENIINLDKNDIINIVHNSSEIEFNYIKIRYNDLSEDNNDESTDLLILKNIIKTEYKKNDYNINGFVKYNKNHYGIKIYTGDDGYMFEFKGSINKLADHIIRILEETERNIIVCPFCKTNHLKKEMYGKSNCDICKSVIITQLSKPSDLKPKMLYFGGKSLENCESDYDTDYLTWFIKENDYENFIKHENDEFLYHEKLEELLNIEQPSIIISDFSFDNLFILKNEELKQLINKIISEICIDYNIWLYSDEYRRGDIIYNSFFMFKLFDNLFDWVERDSNSPKFDHYSDYYYIIGEYVTKNLNEYVYNYLNIEEYDDMDSEQESQYLDLESDLIDFIKNELKNITPGQSYYYYNYIADHKINETQKMIEEYNKISEEKKNIAKKIWSEYFPELKNFGKITKDKANRIGFFEKLEKISKILSDEELSAIKTNLPDNKCSNSVDYEISNILSKI